MIDRQVVDKIKTKLPLKPVKVPGKYFYIEHTVVGTGTFEDFLNLLLGRNVLGIHIVVDWRNPFARLS